MCIRDRNAETPCFSDAFRMWSNSAQKCSVLIVPDNQVLLRLCSVALTTKSAWITQVLVGDLLCFALAGDNPQFVEPGGRIACRRAESTTKHLHN
eukprot:5777-Lingulodinium_polyedra.AAC.1